MTKSMITRIPRSWAAVTKSRKSSTVPMSGRIIGVVGDVIAAVPQRRAKNGGTQRQSTPSHAR